MSRAAWSFLGPRPRILAGGEKTLPTIGPEEEQRPSGEREIVVGEPQLRHGTQRGRIADDEPRDDLVDHPAIQGKRGCNTAQVGRGAQCRQRNVNAAARSLGNRQFTIHRGQRPSGSGFGDRKTKACLAGLAALVIDDDRGCYAFAGLIEAIVRRQVVEKRFSQQKSRHLLQHGGHGRLRGGHQVDIFRAEIGPAGPPSKTKSSLFSS